MDEELIILGLKEVEAEIDTEDIEQVIEQDETVEYI